MKDVLKFPCKNSAIEFIKEKEKIIIHNGIYYKKQPNKIKNHGRIRT